MLIGKVLLMNYQYPLYEKLSLLSNLLEQYRPIYNLLQNMIKKITCAFAIILGVILLYYSKTVVQNYVPRILKKNQVNELEGIELMQDDLSLQNLEKLTSVPLIGQYFLEDKLKLLVRLRKWRQVLNENVNAQGIFTTKLASNLLIYRAIAECATYQFRKCETTIREIDDKVPHLYEKISYLDIKNRNASLNSRKVGKVLGQSDYLM